MKTDKIKSALIAVACSLSVFTTVANGEVTAPVGYVQLTFNAESDTPFSLPMNRPKIYSGQVSSISGNTITIANEDLTANALVYNDGSLDPASAQNERYYVLFTTGTLEGRTFDVEVNGTNTITVLQGGDSDLATLISSTTDNFDIRPHWTLGTLFPIGSDFPAISNSFGTPIVLIQARPNDVVGNNIPINESYYFVTGDGWYNTSNPIPGNTVNDTVLSRNTFYIFRNIEGPSYVKNVIGDVPVTDERTMISVLSDFISQDNYVSFPYPIDLTLGQTGLRDASFFAKSDSGFANNGDNLLVYNYELGGFDQPTVSSYYVTDAGWYEAANPFTVLPDNTVLETAGRAFVIRTNSDKEESSTQLQVPLPYLPFAP